MSSIRLYLMGANFAPKILTQENNHQFQRLISME